MNDWHYEDHPEWYHDIPEMQTLILGSFPPYCSKWYYPFYYPNTSNRFWKVLNEIANPGIQLTKFPKKDKEKFEAKALEERKAIMQKLKVGVQNMGLKIKRKGKSANDTDITIEEYQNILSIIKSHPELKTILLPGYHAKHSTYRSFLEYLKSNDIDVPTTEPKPLPLKTSFEIIVGDQQINCVVLNSTSSASRVKIGELVSQFQSYIRE